MNQVQYLCRLVIHPKINTKQSVYTNIIEIKDTNINYMNKSNKYYGPTLDSTCAPTKQSQVAARRHIRSFSFTLVSTYTIYQYGFSS